LPGVVRMRSSNARSFRACWRFVTLAMLKKIAVRSKPLKQRRGW
jgi:hypothetical protein